ncbi:MAG: outer membrane protein assembly factor [Salinibacter sp.]
MSGHRRRVIYPTGGAVLLVLAGLFCGGGRTAAAQTSASASSPDAPATQWRLVLDGEPAAWPDTVSTAPLDSLRAVGRRVLAHLRRKGYYYARLDSATVDTNATPAVARLYAHRGPQVRIAELRLKGDSVVPEEALRALMETEAGDRLRPARLEADIQALLDRYEAIGRPLAQVRVAETRLTREGSPRLRVTLRIEEGPKLWLKRIEVPDDARTTPALLAHLAGLEVGEPLRDYDPEALQRRLQEHDLFQEVGAPTLRITADGGAVLRIPVEEAPPGAFDFVIGYLPPARTRDSGQLVGSGHLLLKHLFGGGRTAEFTLDRRPGRTSIFDVSLSDPYVFGLPLRIKGHFRGEQRDSTYGERIYELDGGYRLDNGLTLTATLSREVVRPGPAGTQFLDGRQQIPRSTTLFFGVGLRYRQLDRPQNPRRGVSVDIQVAQGQKDRHLQRITADGDTVQVSNSVRQERLRAQFRAYLPLFDRQVLAVGGDGSVLLSPDGRWDRSDLFRLGGATSLRGYDEDRFLGNVVARGLVEYRLQLDRASYAHAFFDLGYVARPALTATTATQGWHPGYGLGLRLQTALGRLSVTYALNPNVQSLANGRVHLGLSVGL